MNETIKIQLNHRTIRKFKKEKVKEKDLKKMLMAANQAPSANGLQRSSIIRISDQKIKDKLALIGGQDYMKDSTELLVFIADLYRNARIGLEKGEEINLFNSIDLFFQAMADSYLQAQNLVLAAESLGYGTNYFGNIFNNIDEVIKILNLPKLTFPVIALGLGFPDQNPQLKPRITIEKKVFENSYKIFDNYLDEFKNYDELMQNYYDLRNPEKPMDAFTSQVINQAKKIPVKRKSILDSLKKQGFIFDE